MKPFTVGAENFARVSLYDISAFVKALTERRADTSRETVTTQLNRFARLGLLKRQARRLIVNKSGLLAFIQSEEARLKNLGFAAAGSR